MSNVLVNKDKIDILANAISTKSGEPLTLTLDEMVEAVDGIETGGGITPTGNIDITQAGVTDVTSYATATVPQGEPWIGYGNMGFYTDSNNRRWRFRPMVEFSEGEQVGWMDTDTFGNYYSCRAVAKNTTVTPSTSSQTIGGTNYMMEGAVTVSAMPSGTAGTPTATKGAVSNHSVSVTPAVTNTTGYITGGTLTGTAVTVSASELVSGSSSITANASGIDVTNLSTVDVNVAGGAATLQTKTKAYTPSTKQQTEAITYDEGYDGLDTVNVTVDAMASGQALPPATLIGNGTLSFDTNKVILSQNFMTSAIVTSGYISSATTALTSVSLSATLYTRSEADLTVSGSVVTAKSGYYSASASKAVAAGTAGTPTASKGTVTNNAVSVTPKVTNTTGYITGGTLTGTAVTVSASELVSGTSMLTQNTTYDVTNLSSVTVNVPTSGGGSFQGNFLSSSNLGTITTTSTTAYALNKSLTITNVYGYDGLLVETSVDSQTNGRHTATTGLFWLTGSTNIATKTSGVTANARWNAKLSTNGTSTTRASTTAYGVFGSTCTMSTSSNGTATITMYARYNSNHTGTMNGNYTARVYGFNIANLIGG